MPFYKSVIIPSMQAGKTCLIVAHANTIRTLIKQIDRISDEDIKGMTIPTGIPLLYRLDKDMNPVDPVMELEFQYMVEPKGYVSLLSLLERSTSDILVSHISSVFKIQIYLGYSTCSGLSWSLPRGSSSFTGNTAQAGRNKS
jgi:hypothetical protein